MTRCALLVILAVLCLPARLGATPIQTSSGHYYFYSDGNVCLTDSAGVVEVPAETTLVCVKIDPDSTLTDSSLVASGYSFATVVLDSLPENYYTLEIPADSNGCWMYYDSLEAWNNVEWARFEVRGIPYSSPNDTYYSDQWGFSNEWTMTEEAWDSIVADGSVLIGVLDSGDDSHEDLRFSSLGNDYQDLVGHGTAVAGILGALANNSKGVAGVAGRWTTASGTDNIVAYGAQTSVADDGFFQIVNFSTQTKAGLQLLAAAGVGVINMSMGSPAPAQNFKDIDDIIESIVTNDDVVIVCASGQGAGATLDLQAFPASSQHTVGVRAIQENGTLFGHYESKPSIYSAGVDLLAPGGINIVTTDIDPGGIDTSGKYTTTDTFGGTSAAAPVVAGIAALIREADSGLDAGEVIEILRHSARKISGMASYYDPEYGYGLANTLGAIVGVNLDAQFLDGTVSFSRTVPDPSSPFSNVFLGGDVTVASGCTLTVAPGATVYSYQDLLESGADVALTELIVEGHLEMVGTSGSPISVRSESGTDGDWYGIHVKSGGTANIAYTTIKDAEIGVLFASSGSGSIDHVTFAENTVADLFAGAGSSIDLTVSDCTFTVGGGYGIQTAGTVDGLSVDGCSFTGSSSSSAAIKIGSLAGSSDAPEITDCTISGFSAAAGIETQTCDTYITSNDISSGKWGVRVLSGTPDVGTTSGGNDIYSNTTGVMVEGGSSSPTVRMNYLYSNTYGVQVKTGGDPDVGTSSQDGDNAILSSGTYCIWNRNTSGTPQVRAQGNYFGSCSYPSCTNGNVDASGYLCSSPLSIDDRIEVVRVASNVSLLALRPNPTRDTARLVLKVDGVAAVHLEVFDVLGRRIYKGADATIAPGSAELSWNGYGDNGAKAAAGVYFLRVVQEDKALLSAKLLITR